MNFAQRFDLKVDLSEAQTRFVNRILTLLFLGGSQRSLRYGGPTEDLKLAIAAQAGVRYNPAASLAEMIDNDFARCLQAVEVFYTTAAVGATDPAKTMSGIDTAVRFALLEAEVDLGIEWHEGKFSSKGAKVLDENIMNESLRWLSDPAYISVYKPFQKSLRHLLESGKRRELLSDAVTDAYESLEALAKIVCRNKKDLSANREQFLSKINASKEFKGLLKQYVEFGNDFRHAANPDTLKPTLSASEVEFFIYMTGAFIRMAKESRIEQSKKES